MSTELDLAQQLFEANKDGSQSLDATPFSVLDRAAAYRVQTRVLDMLGDTPKMMKTAVHADGAGVVAPILRLDQSGNARLPASRLIGLEVEVGIVLARDITSAEAVDEIEAVEAIDHYFVGVEVCGTRYKDRALAGPTGGLADNMSAFAYVIDPVPRDLGADIDGFDVTIEFAGQRIYTAPAKHGFGTVLASYLAYARNQHPAYPLKAGTIITTGSLCGLVPVSGAGHVAAGLGAHIIQFDIV
jgi:2-keto-4-pentenoate hydratase